MAPFSERKEFWREFLQLYKELPALWKVKSAIYKNRIKKNEGYELLIEKLKIIMPNADREIVTKKINALRTNYRRELKKLNDFKRSGGARKEVLYMPSLWYFKDIDFLREQEVTSTATSTVDQEEDSESCDIQFENKAKENATSRKSSNQTRQRKIVKHKETEERRNELLTMSCENLHVNNEEAEILGKAWALEYKQLQIDQQIFAKKAIIDIFFEARLATLTRHSVVINGFANSFPLARSPFVHFNGTTDFNSSTMLKDTTSASASGNSPDLTE